MRTLTEHHIGSYNWSRDLCLEKKSFRIIVFGDGGVVGDSGGNGGNGGGDGGSGVADVGFFR